MWELLGGMGKSRVIATMALMLLEQGYSKVHILLPTVALMNRDKEEFSDYWVKSCNVQKVEYHKNFEPLPATIYVAPQNSDSTTGSTFYTPKLNFPSY